MKREYINMVAGITFTFIVFVFVAKIVIRAEEKLNDRNFANYQFYTNHYNLSLDYPTYQRLKEIGALPAK